MPPISARRSAPFSIFGWKKTPPPCWRAGSWSSANARNTCRKTLPPLKLFQKMDIARPIIFLVIVRPPRLRTEAPREVKPSFRCFTRNLFPALASRNPRPPCLGDVSGIARPNRMNSPAPTFPLNASHHRAPHRPFPNIAAIASIRLTADLRLGFCIFIRGPLFGGSKDNSAMSAGTPRQEVDQNAELDCK
jgi:hypothetical protein